MIRPIRRARPRAAFVTGAPCGASTPILRSSPRTGDGRGDDPNRSDRPRFHSPILGWGTMVPTLAEFFPRFVGHGEGEGP
jgi:hypothetical protein